jgi:DNA (cytosine-5)-methyltransferase 1
MKFIDSFAGIGGFHLAFHQVGGDCVFASEIDTHARQTYEANFKSISPTLFEDGFFAGDITHVDYTSIPDFDVLCAGFPCQPFSQAGYKRGFQEEKDSRGNMFFNICQIIEAKRPKAVFLENVLHLLKHDDGKTFEIIQNTLEEMLGYDFYYKVVRASDYGLPQHRPRVYMVAFDKSLKLPPFFFPSKTPLKYTMSDILKGNCPKDIGFTLRVGGWGSKIDDRRNWEFYYVDDEIKRIGVSEGKQMMGYPDSYRFPVSETQAMKQLGNSVAVDGIQAVAFKIKEHLSILEKPNDFILQDDKGQLHCHYREEDKIAC